MLQAMAGLDEKDPTTSREPVPNYLADIESGFAGLAIGIDPRWNSLGTDADTQRVVAEAIETCRQAGAEIREVRFPEAKSIVASWTPLCGIEAAVAHEKDYEQRKNVRLAFGLDDPGGNTKRIRALSAHNIEEWIAEFESHAAFGPDTSGSFTLFLYRGQRWLRNNERHGEEAVRGTWP